MLNPQLNRRDFLTASGVTLLGTTFLGGTAFGDELTEDFRPSDTIIQCSGIVAREKLLKPVYLAPANSTDPVAHSIADNLFWNDIMMEHAQFFIMLMPGQELAGPRAQAQSFQQQFARQFQRTCSVRLTRSNIAEFNRSTIALLKPYIDFKLRMRDLQAAGKLKSLVFPLFFDHTAREAVRFSNRLAAYSSGQVKFELQEISTFWTEIMADHAEFVAHLLDPTERELVSKSYATGTAFRGLKGSRSTNLLLKAGDEIIDFKTAAEKGIIAGKIKSIIHPSLADHVRREAIKFVDELKRSN
jgi:hypothetical protein